MNQSTVMIHSEEKMKPVIILLSVVIPLAVAALFRVKLDVEPLSFLPPIYATINGITAFVLVWAVQAIMKGNVQLHMRLIQTALALGAVFLVCYVAYHITSDPTIYGDTSGNGKIEPAEKELILYSRYIYYPLLISHILLSIAVIPLVLFTYAKGIAGKKKQHRRLAKITFPIWLYVTVSGVVVYFMISPYYRA